MCVFTRGESGGTKASSAYQLAVELTADMGANVSHGLAALFFVLSLVFVYRSFYGMRIRTAH